jgi:hypothetical protein
MGFVMREAKNDLLLQMSGIMAKKYHFNINFLIFLAKCSYSQEARRKKKGEKVKHGHFYWSMFDLRLVKGPKALKISFFINQTMEV